jgi:hypothetical protein
LSSTLLQELQRKLALQQKEHERKMAELEAKLEAELEVELEEALNLHSKKEAALQVVCSVALVLCNENTSLLVLTLCRTVQRRTTAHNPLPH